MEERLRLAFLVDFYGALLTDKQRQCLEMYLFDDLSFSEIGEEMRISRQAVYDMVHRSTQVLTDYEEKLGLVDRYENISGELAAVYDSVSELKTQENSDKVTEILKRLEPFLNNQEV